VIARLIVLSGTRQGAELRLQDGTFTVGREAGTNLTFAPEERLVSGTHASITWSHDHFVLRDAESRNGTFVNERRVTEHVLEDGDVIEFGRGGARVQFLLGERPRFPRTLTAPGLATISGMYRIAHARARVPGSDGAPSMTLVMRQFAAVAYERTSRRVMVALSVMAVAGVGWMGFVYWQARAGVREQRAAIAMLDAALREERALRTATAAELSTLREEYASLRAQQETTLATIRGELGFAENAADAFGGAVALLVTSVGFVDTRAHRPVRFVVDEAGKRVVDRRQNPQVTLEGAGPEVSLEATGTAFLVHEDGWMLTNRHVVDVTVDPQLASVTAQLGQRVGRPLEMRRNAVRVFFPGGTRGGRTMTVRRVSTEADVALLQLEGDPAPAAPIPLAQELVSPRPGANVMLLGFPTGVNLLLARADEATRTAIIATAGDDVVRLAGELARHQLIQPFLSTGRISDVTRGDVVFQGGTTHGSSGGPLIDSHGRVIAINYGGWSQPNDPFVTYRAVPIRHGWALLPPEVRAALDSSVWRP